MEGLEKMPKRRGKGDGGLYQRHDHATCPPRDDNGDRPEHRCSGRWVATIETEVDGVHKRKTIYGRTRAQAKSKLDKANAEKKTGTLVVSTTTVEKWLTYWLDEVAELKPQSMRQYRTAINRYLIPRLGHHRLTALRPEHVRDLIKWMRDQGLSESTCRSAYYVLRTALRDAMHDGKIATNPVERVKAPSTKTETRKRLTLDEARAVLTAAGEDARWWLALFYGMRQGEVLGLMWRDVDFDESVLRIRQTLQADKGALIFGPPKSAKGVREIPLMPQVELRLRLLHGQGQDPDALVFPNADGGPRAPRRDYQDWVDLLDRATVVPFAPLPRVALHSARNSAASLLEAAGVPDRLVMEILGHSQVQMTHKYTSADIDRKRQAMAAGGDLLELE